MRRPLSIRLLGAFLLLLASWRLSADSANLSAVAVSSTRIGISVVQEPRTDLVVETSTNLADWVQAEFYPASISTNYLSLERLATNPAEFYRTRAQRIIAPLSLQGLYFVFTNSPFDDVFNALFRGGINDGAFAARRNTNSWEVGNMSAADAPPTTIMFEFSSADRGRFVYPYFINFPVWTGDFLIVPPPVDPLLAPPSLSRIRFITHPDSGVGAADYVIEFTGGASGTFRARDLPGLFGSFVYEPGRSTAHLRMDYEGECVGDFDDAILNFRSFTFLGTQSISSMLYSFNGTFEVVH